MAGLTPCLEPRCPVLVPAGTGRCERHGGPRKAWQSSGGDKAQRIRGRKRQALRERLFTREPHCRECAKAGRVTLATIRDHVVPLAEGGKDVDENTQPLCQVCSDTKTQAEAARGARRARA